MYRTNRDGVSFLFLRLMRQFFGPQLGVLSLVVCVFGALPMAARAEVILTFGTYAADKPTETVRKYRPFLSFLAARMSQRLGEDVAIKMHIAKQYEEGIRQLAEGEVDFARFGPASYVMVKQQNPDVRIVAIESKKGEKRFKGVIVVHRDSPVQSLEELSGLTFAFGDELSTIGRYLAQSELLKAGISGSDLHSFSYLGRHDLVGEAVGAGKFAAGALKESTYKKLVAKGVPIRVLMSFDNVTKPWLASADLDEAVLEAMRAVMLSSQNEEIVRRVSKNGFLASTDADYDFIRDAIAHSRGF